MPLQIHSAPPPEPEEVAPRMKQAIESAVPGASVEVSAVSPGHYEIEVVAEAFANLPRVKQQQMVYRAVADFMSGDAPPVHAVDRLVTRTS